MALELVQPGIQPLGQFDGADSVYLAVKGGEVGAITNLTIATDSGAADVDDGYIPGGTYRPGITTALTSGMRPLGLIDDGIWGYGTLFGSVIGGIAGQVSYGLGQVPATQLGPHTAQASGKLTFWDKPGTYAVTLDAVDTRTYVGLQPTNGSLNVGAALYAMATGLLTPASGDAFEAVEVGYFLNFEPWKGGSLVTTPVSLVSAPNSPVGQGQPQNANYQRALIHFNPPDQS